MSHTIPTPAPGFSVRRTAGGTSWGAAIWIIAFAAALYVLSFAGPILLPTVFAVVLALVLSPVARALARLRLNDAASAVVTVALASALVIAAVATLAPAADEWIADAPRFAAAIDEKIAPFLDRLEAVGDVSQQIVSGTGDGTAAQSSPSAAPAAPAGLFGSVVSYGVDLISQTIYVLFLTLFLLALRGDLSRRLILFADSTAGRLHMARAIRDVERNVGGYLFILTAINAGVAVATALAFWAAGLPSPIVWGLAYGVSNFVPIIGPTATIAVSALVGAATEPTLVGGLVAPGILLAINLVESQLVSPWLMARRIDINPVVLFLGLSIVVWLWGIGAAIVAAPILVIVYTFSKHIPRLNPLAIALAPVQRNRTPIEVIEARKARRELRARIRAARAALAASTPTSDDARAV